MLRSLRTHLSYSNIIATIALFAALGGSSYAAVKLSRDSVRTGHIKNGQVKGVDVADGSIRINDLNKNDAAGLTNDVRVTRLRGLQTSFVQRADEVVDVVAEAKVTPPPGCDDGMAIELLVDGVPMLSGYSSRRESIVPLSVEDAGDDRLFEPGSDTTHEVTVDATDFCENGGHTIDSIAVDVLRYR